MSTKQTKSILQINIENLVKQTQTLMANLYERWQDEKEYEDFADYEKVIKEAVDKIGGITFIKGTKRPFGFQYELCGRRLQYAVKVKGRYLSFETMDIGKATV